MRVESTSKRCGSCTSRLMLRVNGVTVCGWCDQVVSLPWAQHPSIAGVLRQLLSDVR